MTNIVGSVLIILSMQTATNMETRILKKTPLEKDSMVVKYETFPASISTLYVMGIKKGDEEIPLIAQEIKVPYIPVPKKEEKKAVKKTKKHWWNRK